MMIENLILITLLVLIPVSAIIWLARRSHRDKYALLVHSIFTTSLIIFLTLWGQYGLVASHYLRPILWLGLLLALVLSWRRPLTGIASRSAWSRVPVALVALTVSAMCLLLSFQALRGHSTDLQAIDLAFPLQGGKWYVGSGGSSLVINLHFRPQTPYQHYAIDVHQINRLGVANKKSLFGNNEDHMIFGETLYSPCNGRVLTAVDGVPDNAAGEYYEGEQGSGNHVLIQCQDVEISLVHMLAGSVLVREGEKVTVGTPLGQVGNSGFSTEPHLHLQALKTNSDGKVTSIPMHFNGRFLVRNDVIKNQAHNQ